MEGKEAKILAREEEEEEEDMEAFSHPKEPSLKNCSNNEEELKNLKNESTCHEAEAEAIHVLDLESQQERQKNSLHHVRSHMSTHDATPVHDEDSNFEAGDEIYDKFTAKRKVVIVCILSFCSFLAPMSSTSILSASPEVSYNNNTIGLPRRFSLLFSR